MLKTFASIAVLALALSLTSQARAQAIPTASAPAALQVGAGYTIISPDYGRKDIQGATIFADYDFGLRWGVEADVHIGDLRTPTDIAEVSYLAGPRVKLPVGKFNFYAKALIGSSNFRVLETQDNQGVYDGYYLTYAFGGGLDYRATRHIVIRAIDLESQRWPNYGRDGLTPLVYTFGVAYHFH